MQDDTQIETTRSPKVSVTFITLQVVTFENTELLVSFLGLFQFWALKGGS